MKLNKLIALLLAVTMLFAFVGCPHGNEPEEPVNTTPANNQPSTPSTDDPNTPSTDDPNTPSTDDPVTPPAPEKPAAPVINPNGGEVNIGTLVTLSTETEGAVIVYKFGDASDNMDDYISYNAEAKPVIETAAKIVAMVRIGTEGAYMYSDPVTAEFTIAKVADPVISPNGSDVAPGQEVTLSCETVGAEISYKFGEDGEWTVYNDAAKPTVTEAVTIYVKATKPDTIDSEVVQATFSIATSTTETPSIGENAEPVVGGYEVTITAEEGAVIYWSYTELTQSNYTDGTIYKDSIVVSETGTLYAVAKKDGSLVSEVATKDFTVETTAAPSFDPNPADAILLDRNIFISQEFGATIYYKINDGEWTEYTEAFTIEDDATITAKAEKAGEKVSEEVTVEYTVAVSAAPVITLDAGEYWKGTKVTITAAEDATIVYGFDSDFSPENYQIYADTNRPVINENTTLYAVAVEANKKNSALVSADYTTKVAAKPVLPKAGAVPQNTYLPISCATSGATIIWNDTGDVAYGNGIPFNGANESSPCIDYDKTIYAVAVIIENGEAVGVSEVAEVSYTVKEIPAGCANDSIYYWYDGTVNRAFSVYDVEDLKELARIVNAGNSLAGVTITQAADITVNNNLLKTGFLEPDEGADVTPNPNFVNLDSIGQKGATFNGTYDGNDKVISGLYIYGGHQGLAFIGATGENAVVKNLTIVDACVINKNADTSDGSDDDRWGGIVGISYGTTTIENCVFTGVIGSAASKNRDSGHYEYAAGLIGRCDATTTVTNCTIFERNYASAHSTATPGNSKAKITATNTVVLSPSSLSYTGNNEYILDAIAHFVAPAAPVASPVAGEVEANTPIELTADAGDIYYMFSATVPEASAIKEEGTLYSDSDKPVITEAATLYAVAVRYGLTSEVASFTYKLPGAIEEPVFDKTAGDYTSAIEVTITTATDDATIYYSFVTDGSTPDVDAITTEYTSAVSVNESGVLFAVAKKDDKASMISSVAYTFVTNDIASGLVDGVKKYTVSSVNGLNKLAELVNGGNTLSGYTFIQTDDIQFNEAVLAEGSWDAPAETKVVPEGAEEGTLPVANCQPAPGLVVFDGIGSKANPFAGTYNGQGYSITGVYIYGGQQGLAFFGGTSAATIKNVIIMDACVVNKNATSADESDDDRFGGLIGSNYGDGTIIENCIFVGTIGSQDALDRGGHYQYAAGLIGNCEKTATATNCIVVANVIPTDNAGPICVKNASKLTITQNNGVDTVRGYTSAEFDAAEDDINMELFACTLLAQSNRQ